MAIKHNKKHFGKKLLSLRKKHKITRSVLSKKVCISVPTIINIEIHHILPSLNTAIKLSKFFKLSVSDFVGDSAA